MKTAYKFLSVIISVLMVFAITSCSTEKEKITVGCIKGPTGVGMTKLMQDDENGKTENDYEFTVATSPDEISSKIISGEINIASVPTNLASALYAKTEGKIVLLAANTQGVLSIVENGEKINSVDDLKGKTIYSTGEGANPEYILRYVLEQNGLDPDNDVQIEFVTENDELVSYLVSGKATVAMVPEPAATTVLMKNQDLRRAIRINDEWEKLSEGELIMGCVVAQDTFVESHEDEIEAFLTEYEESINYVKENISDAAALCEKYEITANAKIAENAIEECNLVFLSGSETKEKIKPYFDILMSYNAKAVGGKLPGDDFYYEKD